MVTFSPRFTTKSAMTKNKIERAKLLRRLSWKSFRRELGCDMLVNTMQVVDRLLSRREEISSLL